MIQHHIVLLLAEEDGFEFVKCLLVTSVVFQQSVNCCCC